MRYQRVDSLLFRAPADVLASGYSDVGSIIVSVEF